MGEQREFREPLARDVAASTRQVALAYVHSIPQTGAAGLPQGQIARPSDTGTAAMIASNTVKTMGSNTSIQLVSLRLPAHPSRTFRRPAPKRTET